MSGTPRGQRGVLGADSLTLASALGLWPNLPPADVPKIARDCNKYGAKVARDHPHRFGLVATLWISRRLRCRDRMCPRSLAGDFGIALGDEGDWMVRTAGPADHREAARAFIGKRKPNVDAT